jgi:hypothetical protein
VPRKKSGAATKRQARARELRTEIDRLTGKLPSSPSNKPESPAAFVHRRMAELTQQEQKKQSRSRR